MLCERIKLNLCYPIRHTAQLRGPPSGHCPACPACAPAPFPSSPYPHLTIFLPANYGTPSVCLSHCGTVTTQWRLMMRTFNCLEFLYSQNPLWVQIVFRVSSPRQLWERDTKRYQRRSKLLKIVDGKSCGFSSHTAIRSKWDQSADRVRGEGGVAASNKFLAGGKSFLFPSKRKTCSKQRSPSPSPSLAFVGNEQHNFNYKLTHTHTHIYTGRQTDTVHI